MYIYIFIYVYIYIYTRIRITPLPLAYPTGFEPGVAYFVTIPFLRGGLYKILFCGRAFVHESRPPFAYAPFDWAPHPTPSSFTLLRNRMFPPTPRYCNTRHTILEIGNIV